MTKRRYEIRDINLDTLSQELNEAVNKGEYPKYDTQPNNRKTHVVTRNFYFPVEFLRKYFRRN